MPVYEYKALDGKGRGAAGVIDADTPRDAREKLRFQKIYVTEITEVRGTAAKREVVKTDLGEKKVVISTQLPKVMQICAVLAFMAAGAEILMMLMQMNAPAAAKQVAGSIDATAQPGALNFVIWPSLKVVLGQTVTDAQAQARARQTVKRYARLNLVLALPVTFIMVAAAHLS